MTTKHETALAALAAARRALKAARAIVAMDREAVRQGRESADLAETINALPPRLIYELTRDDLAEAFRRAAAMTEAEEAAA